MFIVKKWLSLYIVRKVTTMTIKIKILCLMSASYIQYSSFWEQIFRINYNEQAFITIKEKNKTRPAILRPRFLRDIVGKMKTSSTWSWPMFFFRCNTTENFIFLLKYRQWKVYLQKTPAKNSLFLLQYDQLSYMSS